MTDMISRDRAVAHIAEMAEKMAATMPQHEYASGYLDGFRGAARAISAMLSDKDAEAIAAMKAERANA